MVVRAAQNVPMSTDQPILSIDTQKGGYRCVCPAKGMEVVATYEDHGKSGIVNAWDDGNSDIPGSTYPGTTHGRTPPPVPI